MLVVSLEELQLFFHDFTIVFIDLIDILVFLELFFRLGEVLIAGFLFDFKLRLPTDHKTSMLHLFFPTSIVGRATFDRFTTELGL